MNLEKLRLNRKILSYALPLVSMVKNSLKLSLFKNQKYYLTRKTYIIISSESLKIYSTAAWKYRRKLRKIEWKRYSREHAHL